ncbi:MAG: hypothetical protein JOZ02_00705 [Acidobacteria bacterium]|nr:hypothetical protein [Acidobacteriota bacterium]
MPRPTAKLPAARPPKPTLRPPKPSAPAPPRPRAGLKPPKLTPGPKQPRAAQARLAPVRQPRAARPRVSTPRTLSAERKRVQRAVPRDRNSQAYKQYVAKKGVAAVRQKFYRMGFDSVRQVQHNKVHGVDLAAYKYGKDGRLINAAAAEVKSSGSRRPGPKSIRRQTTHGYVTGNLARAAAARPKVRDADKLYRLARQRRLNIYGGTYLMGERGAKLHKVYEPRPVKQGRPSPLTVRSKK